MRTNKNTINDFIMNYKNGLYKFHDLKQLVEYAIGLRNAMVFLNGEEEDGAFVNFLIDNLDDYILVKDGVIVVSPDLEKAKKVFEIVGSENEDYKLGLCIGYPKCCVENWDKLQGCEYAAIHTSEMKKHYTYLSYVPCSGNCEESRRRERRLFKIFNGGIKNEKRV